MTAAAVRLLARGWWRGGRAWWLAAMGAMALALSAILVVQGTVAGITSATESRVADFYTGGLRATPGAPAAAPSVLFPDDATSFLGPEAVWRLEAPGLLGRTTLLETYLDPEASLNVTVPGGAPAGGSGRGLGVLVGISADDAVARSRVTPHLVAGALPDAAAGLDTEVQLILSLRTFSSYLTAGERAAFASWPPDADALRAIRFEVTAGHLSGSGASRDIVRAPARAVGLYDTGLAALDDATFLAPIEDVRRLTGNDPAGGAANVAVLPVASPEAVRVARENGWGTESATGFAARSLGEWLPLVGALATALGAALFAWALFLLWHGVSQQLRAQEREVAVCRAIGVPARVLGGALLALSGAVVAGGLLGAALLGWVGAAWAPQALAGWRSLPMPVAFHLEASTLTAVVALALASTLLALVLAAGRQARRDLASTLRAS